MLAHQRVRDQNERLNLLTASVSHDMMTPLKCIITYATYLLSSVMSETDRQKVVCILRTAQMLTQQTKDLLDRALIDNESLTITPKSTMISKAVQEVVTILTFQAEQLGVSIEYLKVLKAPRETELMVDAPRLQQVVFNLLSNALKFSERGEQVNVKLQIIGPNESEEDSEGKVILQVIDNGIGMTNDQMKRLWKPFAVGKDAESRRKNPSGNGLGLSICKNIMKAMNGDIDAVSYRKMGTTFTAWFPIDSSQARKANDVQDITLDMLLDSIDNSEENQITTTVVERTTQNQTISNSQDTSKTIPPGFI